ncbi:DUF7342 family protein [Halorutilus salinus]
MPRGRDRELTKEDVLDILRSGTRPVYTAAQVAERTDVSKTTAKNRLQELAETDMVDSIKVSNATAYYVVGIKTVPNVESKEEHVRNSVKNYWEGRFVGGVKDMSVVPTHDDEDVSAGDTVQLVVTGGGPSMKTVVGLSSGDEYDEIPSAGTFSREQREENEYGGEVATVEFDTESFDSTTALLSAELGERFAVPIVEKELGNFDTPAPGLEDSNTEWKFEVVDDVPRLHVAGVGAYLLRPCENAVYIKNVDVVDIEHPPEEDNPLAGEDFHKDMELEIGEETRSEVIEFEDLHDG